MYPIYRSADEQVMISKALGYGLLLSDTQRQLFKVWDREDPVSEWEVMCNARIDSIVQRRRLAMMKESGYSPSP